MCWPVGIPGTADSAVCPRTPFSDWPPPPPLQPHLEDNPEKAKANGMIGDSKKGANLFKVRETVIDPGCQAGLSHPSASTVYETTSTN